LCVAVCCSVLQCVAVCCSVLQCVAACCSVLQCVVCCSVLQCVAVCCSELDSDNRQVRPLPPNTHTHTHTHTQIFSKREWQHTHTHTHAHIHTHTQTVSKREWQHTHTHTHTRTYTRTHQKETSLICFLFVFLRSMELITFLKWIPHTRTHTHTHISEMKSIPSNDWNEINFIKLIDRNPPPGGVFYLLCSLIRNREWEDPPRRIQVEWIGLHPIQWNGLDLIQFIFCLDWIRSNPFHWIGCNPIHPKNELDSI